jgi:lysophospholipase L1-like esterase
MIRILILNFLLSLFASCNKNTTAPPIIAPASPNTKTFLALGDSYTIGQSVSPAERFPMQTAALLKQEGIVMADPVYIAQTGWTTINLQQAIKTQNPLPGYDLVTLLIGVNDQYQGMDTASYAIRFTELLEKSIWLGKGIKSNVFVLSIPDYSVTPFVASANKPRVKMEIEWFNKINRRITTEYGISYTDITASTREAETNAALIANDNLHPSGLEYKKWAEMLAPKMKVVLQ